MIRVELRMLDTGHCRASLHHVMRGAPRRPLRCHALVGLLRHPVHGWGLWDAGYTQRMYAATARWPARLFRLLTPLHLDPALDLTVQLPRLGVHVHEIGWVVVSHLHADHVGALRDLPAADIFMSTQSLAWLRTLHGRTARMRALRRAVLLDLLPRDLATRARKIDTFAGPALPGLGGTHDLWGDGSMRLVRLPGHARGQLGMLVRTPARDVLLAADGAWLNAAIRTQRPPHPMTFAIVDDRSAVRDTLRGLGTFAAARPDVAIMPTHCPEVYAREVARCTS